MKKRQMDKITEMIKTGEVEVPNTKEKLKTFLDEMNCDFGNLGY